MNTEQKILEKAEAATRAQIKTARRILKTSFQQDSYCREEILHMTQILATNSYVAAVGVLIDGDSDG